MDNLCFKGLGRYQESSLNPTDTYSGGGVVDTGGGYSSGSKGSIFTMDNLNKLIDTGAPIVQNLLNKNKTTQPGYNPTPQQPGMNPTLKTGLIVGGVAVGAYLLFKIVS
jgi:hypothetical protein